MRVRTTLSLIVVAGTMALAQIEAPRQPPASRARPVQAAPAQPAPAAAPGRRSRATATASRTRSSCSTTA